MKDQKSLDALTQEPSAMAKSMQDIWTEASKEFEKICHESLPEGEVKFDDVLRRVEMAGAATYEDEQKDKWEKAKRVGLESLKYLKMLVGAASQASSLIPVPAVVANVASGALCFVFDIPKAIKGYNDAIDQVFSTVSPTLAQFRIYESIDMGTIDHNAILIKQIRDVMVSFVKICAHVVKYRQSSKDRILGRVKAIFDGNSELKKAIDEFKLLTEQQRGVEGTITLETVVKSRKELLDRLIALSGLAEETQRGVQTITESNDRKETLIKIRDTLGVWQTAQLDGNTTRTCTDISRKCLSGTGEWIWEHADYTAWMAGPEARPYSPILLISGTPSSGKTSVSALITKRLEAIPGPVYVAHYFFPPSNKKSDDEKNPVLSALKYMAFQISRVDATTRKALGKACNDPSAFRHSESTSLDGLNALWSELKIGETASRATYYLVFDGLEHLPDEQAQILFCFIFRFKKPVNEFAGQVRVLASGTDELFKRLSMDDTAPRIQLNCCNGSDIRLIIKEELTRHAILQHAGSNKQQVWDKIIDRLPQNVQGDYWLLKIALDNVIRLLSTRSTAGELDQILNEPPNSHETAIKDLQRSLTKMEVSELNELLKWVLFSRESLTLDKLEAAMFLYSGRESLASLQDVIKAKYSALLKIEGSYVVGQTGVKEHFQRKSRSTRSPRFKNYGTISMTISINNVDEERCSHFLWDLAQKSASEKFDFDKSSISSSTAGAILVDEFEANHTIVTRAFTYLGRKPDTQTIAVGEYLVCWLPYHLNELLKLAYDEQGELTLYEKFEIGHQLYTIFRDREVFDRHMGVFEDALWWADEIETMQLWLMDPLVTRKLKPEWRQEVTQASSPTWGYLKVWVGIVVKGFVKGRSWDLRSVCRWIAEFMKVDKKTLSIPSALSSRGPGAHDSTDHPEPSGSTAESAFEFNWKDVSDWCQRFLGGSDPQQLQDSLWYERLASAASLLGNKSDVVMSLWEHAIEKENPSWQCFRELGKLQYVKFWTRKEGIMSIEQALKKAEQEGATPKPDIKDIVDLHLLLWQYGGGDVRSKVEYYLAVRESGDKDRASRGYLGHLIVSLRMDSPDVEATRESLKNTLDWDDGRDSLITILKILARNSFHDVLVSRLFAVAKGDRGLLEKLMRTMKIASTECHSDEIDENKRLAEAESRGILLYDLGVAIYTYGVTPSADTDATSEALGLWRKSIEVLTNVGSYGWSTYIIRRDALSALAKHYFEDARGSHPKLDSINVLTKLAEHDSESIDSPSEAAGFLGALYAIRKEKHQARQVLRSRMKEALFVLSDNTPENDAFGFSTVYKTLCAYQDLENAAIALSFLGQPDLVTDALYNVDDKEIDDDVENRAQVLELADNLARNVVQFVKSQVPNASQQIQRLKVARTYVDSLVPAAIKLEAGDSDDTAQRLGVEDPLAAAHSLIQSRISKQCKSYLQKLNTDSFDDELVWRWSCDGRTPDGSRCSKKLDFEHPLYHCIYCIVSRDFCADCLQRLRQPTGAEITACSASHRWLQMPPLGHDMYVGVRAKRTRVPQGVKMVEDGEQCILKIFHAEDSCGEEITIEAWKERLAKEWEIKI